MPLAALRNRLDRAGAAVDLPVIWLLTAPGWLPLLGGRQLGTHDGYYHLYRLYELVRALRAGDLYPRWADDFALGYGYPVFNYYAPLLLYLAAPFALLGASPIAAINLAQLAAALLAGASAYLLGRDLFGRMPGLVAGALYGSQPYLLVDLYVRGAVAETLGLALLPLTALLLRRAAPIATPRAVAAGAASVALLAFAHNITILLALPVLAFSALLRGGRLVALGSSIALGLLAATIYWLPALAERDLVSSEVLTTLFYDFHNHFQPLPEVVQRTPCSSTTTTTLPASSSAPGSSSSLSRQSAPSGRSPG